MLSGRLRLITGRSKNEQICASYSRHFIAFVAGSVCCGDLVFRVFPSYFSRKIGICRSRLRKGQRDQ